MRISIALSTLLLLAGTDALAKENYYKQFPFGTKSGPEKWSDSTACGKWWEQPTEPTAKELAKAEKTKHLSRRKRFKIGKHYGIAKWFKSIPREEALAFALYTQDHGVLKLTAQCFPLLPDEPKTVVLELKKNGEWVKVDEQPILYPGWDVHFRVDNLKSTKDIPYRLKLGNLSAFEGLVRKDPVNKETISVASLNCNSPQDKELFTRTQLVKNLLTQDPDLLFFAGDQNYNGVSATYGWLQFGMQFRDVLRNRPTVCIPDDHDVGHGNLWGEGGRKSDGKDGCTDGGYKFPAEFVKMVERQQTWNLPDPFDGTPVKQNIGVYYTDLNVGGVSFAILEDRKFKSAPKGKIPKMGPRYDHIRDPKYDRNSINLPGLKLLGDRQLTFLDNWARDWSNTQAKVVLSQTAFCGAVHLHANKNGRLLADLDSNGWPQAGRDRALRAIRAARASHLCGDQHLGVVVQHGIEEFRDGPFAFTAPAAVNTIYARYWWPKNEKPGGGTPISSSLPWVGDYEDGFGNKITMMAYANPEHQTTGDMKDNTPSVRQTRADGYGMIKVNKKSGNVVFECWPRFADLSKGDVAQFPGWPVTFNTKENDGRKAVGYLKEVTLPVENAVVELTDDETGELVYSHRVKGNTFKAPVYSKAKHTLKAGLNRGEKVLLSRAVAE